MLFLFCVFYYLANIAVQGKTYSVQNITVIAYDLVLV